MILRFFFCALTLMVCTCMFQMCEVWLILMFFSFCVSLCEDQRDRGGSFCFVTFSWYLHGCCIMVVHFADTHMDA